MVRLLAPVLMAAVGAGLLGVGVLIAVLGDLEDSTRASADLVELRADAGRVALLAEDAARSGSDDQLEGAIASIEARSVVVPEVAATALEPAVADPLLNAIDEAWTELALTARLRAQGRATTAELIIEADAIRGRVDALLAAVADANESRLSVLSLALRGAIVAGAALLLLFVFLVSHAIRRQLSDFDLATGLPRQRRMRALLRRRLRSHPGGAAVLAISLDKFERARGALGGQAADRLLAAAGERIAAALGAGHTLGRGAGDDFLVIVDGHHATAVRAASAVVRTLDSPYAFEAIDLRTTASVGIALSGAHGDDADTLLRAAELAQTHARTVGGARYELSDPADALEGADGVLALEAELRRSIDRQDFVLYYQPQVSLQDGRLIGAEALLRWQSPSRGFVSPGLFIPVLEATDLIGPVGDWVIGEASAEAATWPLPAAGPPLRVAVNVSGHQIAEELVQVVNRALAKSRLDPSQLEVEVTETAALRHPEAAMRVLNALREMGVHSALDDFGTGQSSLEHIKALPGDSIKIDRAFVIGIAEDATDRSIVEAVVSIARSLGRTTVAEGVETAEQRDALRALGCDVAQGYLVGRPMPAAEFREFIAGWEPGLLLEPASAA